ncbi:MAG: ABC transporter permease [Deltaproteobacteria bacterium]|nr:MAG: ABC transporter permease [Deltaproteobacteria bacterium]
MGASYFIQRALGDMKENGVTQFLSIGTIAISFFLFCSFLLLSLNFDFFLEAWEKKVQIILYLKDGVGEKKALQLKNKLQREEGIREVRYISQRKAMESFKRDLAGYGGVLEGLKEKIFPASLEIKLGENFRTPERIRALAARLLNIQEVEEVQYGGAWLERLSLFLYILRWGAWVLGGILVIIIVSVTANTARLTLFNKREEIEIMRLMGATNAFVKLPFYLEGGLQGLFGAAGSLLLLFLLFHVFSLEVSPYLSLYFGQLRLSFLSPDLIAGILGVGMASGLLGGFFSLRKAAGF